MRFYFRDFFEAIDGLPDSIGLGYLRLIGHYWGNNHTKGLENNPEVIRKICRIERDEWQEWQDTILGRFFELDEDGMWQQKRAQLLWAETNANYQSAVNRGKAGAAAKWQNRNRQ